MLIFALFCTFSLHFPDFWKIYEFFRKSSIFRRKFHGILPELREIGEGHVYFSLGKREHGGYGEKSQSSHATTIVQSSPQKEPSLEREFSQAESQSSQTTTIAQSTQASEAHSSREEMPAGTVYFASDSSTFQDFSAFQKQDFQYQSFQMNNIQFSTQSFQE